MCRMVALQCDVGAPTHLPPGDTWQNVCISVIDASRCAAQVEIRYKDKRHQWIDFDKNTLLH